MDCKKVIADYWNLRSSTYTNGENGFDAEERIIWRRMLENFLPPGQRLKVLDVGTGPGFLALLFAEMGHEVTAVDISMGMLEKARNNAKTLGVKVDLFHGDAEKLPFEDCYFDLVVNKYLLWTLPQPEIAVQEWMRVLKPGGRVFAIDGNWFNPRPDKKVKRWITGVVNPDMNKNPSRSFFNEFYGPIRKALPLYEDISPENVSVVFSKMGFENTAVNPLQEAQKFKKSKLPFIQRFLRDTPIFLITGQKATE
ncbi:TPA: methyltransferase domain-containing protein [Methanosarcina acetivorans]|uniref:Phosphatidylethanolamine N-methyltransferase n=2 Tax=Methanosarcina acetivorans TaxID=2214 RepID=Q8TIA7_METAC|nr:methyltransferase domain-containing protein [Methanosarcina acetivorans]AAM07593.1 phosphatidylethanolamine N-methyltransferase [Methanosarcina acetivorans C2A]HIH94329.1 methyltransferase domain-containing protein [Methanosarcina acetivorans]